MNSMFEKLKFVIVGHVDHGKSTLIGRLLYDTNSLSDEKIEEIKNICDNLGKEFEFSYITDNLEEERVKGITIDTTQIFFNTEKRKYVIIDAPGHTEFIKNMISGASQADAAVLIIDVNEGVKEQTKRHAVLLQILQLLSPIIIINKMDMVKYDQNKFEIVKKDVCKAISKLMIKPLIVIPTSAKKGDFIVNKSKNMRWYHGPTLLEALDNINMKKLKVDDKNRLRFTVQDVYNFDKKIIVGKVLGGKLRKGDDVKILPSRQKARIKSLEEYLREDVKSADIGKCIGITLDDKLVVDRGCVIVPRKESYRTLKITNRIKTNIFWMDNIPYEKGENLWFRCANQQVLCGIENIEKIINSSSLVVDIKNANTIKNRDVATVIIRTYKPVVVENFNRTEELGRFVLGREDTCAFGTISWSY